MTVLYLTDIKNPDEVWELLPDLEGYGVTDMRLADETMGSEEDEIEIDLPEEIDFEVLRDIVALLLTVLPQSLDE